VIEIISLNNIMPEFNKYFYAARSNELLEALTSANGCTNCGTKDVNTLKRCTGCKFVKYCNVDCQKADWKNHKSVCKTIRSRREKDAKNNSMVSLGG
jgi:hypothetical protein